MNAKEAFIEALGRKVVSPALRGVTWPLKGIESVDRFRKGLSEIAEQSVKDVSSSKAMSPEKLKSLGIDVFDPQKVDIKTIDPFNPEFERISKSMISDTLDKERTEKAKKIMEALGAAGASTALAGGAVTAGVLGRKAKKENPQRKVAFKIGFLTKMAKCGVKPGEFFEKAADLSPASILSGAYGAGVGAGKTLGAAAVPLSKMLMTLGIAAPLAGGVATGTTAAKLSSPPLPDMNAIRKEETIALYRRLAREIRARRRMKTGG